MQRTLRPFWYNDFLKPLNILCAPLSAWSLFVYERSGALMAAALVRVLVAIEPQMYREVLACYFRQQRPRLEVTLASSQTLRHEARRTKPHLIIATEIPPEFKEMGVFWVEDA